MADTMINLKSLQQINSNKARETIVYAYGDRVICAPGPAVTNNDTWINKQVAEGAIGRALRAKGNRAYFVPMPLNADTAAGGIPIVFKERARGVALHKDVFDKLTPADHDVIYRAIANFIVDMAHTKPIKHQGQTLDDDGSFAVALNEARDKGLPVGHVRAILSSRRWFDVASKTDASVIFSHGDMNEDNIMYDAATGTVTFLDLADARYQVADYVIENDFAKLSCLDVNRLRAELDKISTDINFRSNPAVKNMRNALKSFKSSAKAFVQMHGKSETGAKACLDDMETQVKKMVRISMPVISIAMQTRD